MNKNVFVTFHTQAKYGDQTVTGIGNINMVVDRPIDCRKVIKETVESIWGKPPYTEVLDKIRAEIIDKYMTATGEVNTVAKGCLQIIDKYRVDEPVDESVDDPVVKPVDESEERA